MKAFCVSWASNQHVNPFGGFFSSPSNFHFHDIYVKNAIIIIIRIVGGNKIEKQKKQTEKMCREKWKSVHSLWFPTNFEKVKEKQAAHYLFTYVANAYSIIVNIPAHYPAYVMLAFLSSQKACSWSQS